MPRLVTTYSTLDWSADGALVSKTRLPASDARRRFRNELRINRLLNAHRPPVPTSPLVAWDVHRRQLTFAAVPGQPLGAKYPLRLAPSDVDAMIGIALRLRAYSPQRRWLRRFNSQGRLRLARRAGWLTDAQTGQLVALADRVHTRLRFAHGDLTARNVLGCRDGLTLIDWEWAGLYPDGYELAFLWFSLVDVEDGRARVEEHLDADEGAFLLSALLIQLWHLQWYVPSDYRDRHLSTRDDLISRLCR